MQTSEAVIILSALGQPTRLDSFRMLVRSGMEGMPAGEIANEMGVPRNTMSAHLAILARAGLIESERVGTKILYRPQLPRLANLTAYLVEGCCNGRDDLCQPLLREILGAKAE